MEGTKHVFPIVGGPLYDEMVADWFRYLMLFIYLVMGFAGGFACWGFIAFWEWVSSPDVGDF